NRGRSSCSRRHYSIGHLPVWQGSAGQKRVVFFALLEQWLRAVPRRYEEEINEILNKFEGDWPPANKRQQPRHEAPRRGASAGAAFATIGPPQLMLIGLGLIFLGVLLRYGGRLGLQVGFGGYATLVGVLLLFAGYLLAVVRGGSLGVSPRQQMWRGEVIDLRPNNRGLGYWFWRLRAGR